MSSELDYESLLLAGRIACDIKKKVRNIVRPNVPLLDLANIIEGEILRLGGQLAFPVNISINQEAAHYTPIIGDEKRIPESSVVKVDVGVHVNGLIADTAVTVALNEEYEELIKAVEEALDRAISVLAPGVRASAVGAVIEKTINSYGFMSIRNLSGHNMDRYLLHAGITIPNTDTGPTGPTLKPPLLIAIEPFATNGIGWVVDGSIKTIYSIVRPIARKDKRLFNEEAELLMAIYNERRALPFTERWYHHRYGIDFVRSALMKAEKVKIAVGYPVLIEAGGGVVSQAEDTVLLLEKETVITTREC